MVTVESIFSLGDQIVDECLFGDCQILAYYLSKLLKSSKIYFTSSSQYDFIHVAVSYKSYLIDVLGIHTEQEFLENHLILYDVDPNDATLNEDVDPDELGVIFSKSKTYDIKLFQRYAKLIKDSPEFKFFEDNGYPDRRPVVKNKYY